MRGIIGYVGRRPCGDPTVRRTTQKISSRRALVATCADQPDTLVGRRSPELAEHAEQIFYVPFIDPILQVPLPAVPLHLFAHQVARERALNVDQPRNLAKTGTVE
jgi:glucosamine 6-phosphate synthetase-like amidotransferase/phosphosugar isomerase protein